MTAPALPPAVTPATPIHPQSPFPFMEPPQRDVLTSHLFLPDALETVTPASSLHPASPFPNMEAPKQKSFDPSINLFPTPGGPPHQDFQFEFMSGSLEENNQQPRMAGGRSGSYHPGPTPGPGPMKIRVTGRPPKPRVAKPKINHNHSKFYAPQTSLEAPPPIYPVPRTRMVAPRSQQVAINRRLSIDGPTEASLTPLEILAKETVPEYKPDQSFFGTPRSRRIETPLQTLAARTKSKGSFDSVFHESQPVQRSRYQRNSTEKSSVENVMDDMYHHLPGVLTGTTAVGLVEHHPNISQPRFHPPIFTTPIPRNGHFIKLKPMSKAPAHVGTLMTATAIKGIKKVQQLVKDIVGGQPHEVTTLRHGPNPAIRNNFKQVTRPTPKSNGIGRPLQTFSHFSNFKSGAHGSGLVNSFGLCALLFVVQIGLF